MPAHHRKLTASVQSSPSSSRLRRPHWSRIDPQPQIATGRPGTVPYCSRGSYGLTPLTPSVSSVIKDREPILPCHPRPKYRSAAMVGGHRPVPVRLLEPTPWVRRTRPSPDTVEEHRDRLRWNSRPRALRVRWSRFVPPSNRRPRMLTTYSSRTSSGAL